MVHRAQKMLVQSIHHQNCLHWLPKFLRVKKMKICHIIKWYNSTTVWPACWQSCKTSIIHSIDRIQMQVWLEINNQKALLVLFSFVAYERSWGSSVILLPLQPASLKHKNPQTQNNSWHASHRKQRTIARFEGFLVEYPVRVISVAFV